MTYIYPVTNQAPVTVVETEQFAAAARKAKLSEDEIIAIVDYLSRNPESGDLIPGGAGLRKIRFARRGGGKRGGYRIVHYFMDATKPLFLFSVYDKAHKSDLTAAEKQELAALAQQLKRAFATTKRRPRGYYGD